MYGWRARIGRINPSPETVGDEEWRRMMPDGVIVVSTRMFIESVDAPGLTAMVTHVERAAKELATTQPNVILMAGTAGAFNGGAGFDKVLCDRIQTAANGIKATTTMTAVVAALQALRIKSVAVVTPYLESVEQGLVTALSADGFDVPARRSMGIQKSSDMGKVDPHETYAFARSLMQSAGPVEGLLISCGNLRTLEIIRPMERDFGVPIITSNQAGLWQTLQMSGVELENGLSERFGRLFETTLPR
jgi:maleate isomerase